MKGEAATKKQPVLFHQAKTASVRSTTQNAETEPMP
jgi:hypothetical protein